VIIINSHHLFFRRLIRHLFVFLVFYMFLFFTLLLLVFRWLRVFCVFVVMFGFVVVVVGFVLRITVVISGVAGGNGRGGSDWSGGRSG
jgi:uncharacterized membrane protein YgcG